MKFKTLYSSINTMIVSALDAISGQSGSYENDYNQRLVNLAERAPDIELLADGYLVTHINESIVVANGQYYNINVIIESDQLETLCELLDSLSEDESDSYMSDAEKVKWFDDTMDAIACHDSLAEYLNLSIDCADIPYDMMFDVIEQYKKDRGVEE